MLPWFQGLFHLSILLHIAAYDPLLLTLNKNYTTVMSKNCGGDGSSLQIISDFSTKNVTEISSKRRFNSWTEISDFLLFHHDTCNFYLWYQCESELNFLAFQNEIYRLQFGQQHFHFSHFSTFCGNFSNMPFLCYLQAMRLDGLDTIFKRVKYLAVILRCRAYNL